MKTYKFRLYPTKTQEQQFFTTFKLCRFVYNQLLEKLNKSKKPDKNKISHYILKLDKQYPELKTVYSKTKQYESDKLFRNLKGLIQLKKNGRKVGRLRFKGRDFFKSITYNQSGFKLNQLGTRYGKLHLSKIGDINIRCHRITSGKIKQVTIKKTASKWYALIVTDEQYIKQKGTGQIGIDLGIINFLSDDQGNHIKSPLFLNRGLAKIKKAHVRLSRKKLGSKNRQRAKQELGKLYEKINDQRTDFLQKLSTKLVSENQLICMEKLAINKMASKKRKFGNRRNLYDCSWGKFISMVKLKAESAGAQVIDVDPMNTSKTCSNCGTIQSIPLSQRTYSCDCGLNLDRDTNAARNILAQGLGFVESELISSSMKQEAHTL